MTANGWLQIAFFFALIVTCTKPLGSLIASVIEGRKTFLIPVFGPIEADIYKLCGIDPAEEMRWTQYAAGLLAFSAFSGILLYALQRMQGFPPFNPQHFGAGRDPKSTSVHQLSSSGPHFASRALGSYGFGCEAVLPSVKPSAHLIASKYIF